MAEILTIGDDDNVEYLDRESGSEDEEISSAASKKRKKKGDAAFNPVFCFVDQTHQDDFFHNDLHLKRKLEASTLDDKIAKIRKLKKHQDVKDLEKDVDEDDIEEDEEFLAKDTVRVREKRGKKGKNGRMEADAKQTFSESVDSVDESLTFQDLNIARPLMKGLSVMQFSKPTPIQAACIPVALRGRDICACAVTGSGKTVAFMLPILERLMYAQSKSLMSRVLILVPTRELAVQVYQVGRQLAQYTKITLCLAAGGLDMKSQEAALRMGPDIIVATPGRLIDHLHNTPNFSLSSVEVLVLDEADRMLDEYFAEQMKEIIRMCNFHRQTMLFSATMSEAVQDLAAVSLKDPVKVFVNQNTDVALSLRQEFVRIRDSREGDREAIVAALVSRTFCDKCIVFLQTKVQCHRMHIVLGLLGINCGELHGNLSQTQRLETLKNFKEGNIDVLLATDLASRGLDIEGVKTIINFTMPSTLKHYVHRVGRTARAGKSGRSVTLVGEQERNMLKEVLHSAKTPLKKRTVPPEVVMHYRQRIEELEEDIKNIQKEEIEDRQLRAVENQANKAKRLLEVGEGEKREWFQTHKQRMEEKEALRLGKKEKVNKKLSADDRASFEVKKAQLVARRAVRASKKALKPKRMRACAEDADEDGDAKKKRKKKKKKKITSTFTGGLTKTDQQTVRQLRAQGNQVEKKSFKGGRQKNGKLQTAKGTKKQDSEKSRGKQHNFKKKMR